MSAERRELFIGLPENWCPRGKSKNHLKQGLGILLTWMVLGLVFSIYFTSTNKMMCITIHLLFYFFFFSFAYSLLVHDLFFWTWGSLFCQFDFVMLYSLLNHVHCTYIWKVLYFLFSLASMHQSDIFSLLATIVVIFFFCVFCHISVALFKPKDMLAILPHKITAHHEMPRKSLRVMHYCKFLHMRQAVNLWVILQACF